MKSKPLTVFIAITVLLTSSLIGIAQKGKTTNHSRSRIGRWYVFVSPDGDFTLSFPERPSQEPDAAGPGSAIRTYSLYTEGPDRMLFHINFQDTPGDPNTPLQNAWNKDYENHLLSKDREEKRRVIGTRHIGTNGFEAEIWDSSSNTGDSLNYIRQTIMRTGRVYTLLCGSEIYGRPMNKSICRRFLDSMRFIDRSTFMSR